MPLNQNRKLPTGGPVFGFSGSEESSLAGPCTHAGHFTSPSPAGGQGQARHRGHNGSRAAVSTPATAEVGAGGAAVFSDHSASSLGKLRPAGGSSPSVFAAIPEIAPQKRLLPANGAIARRREWPPNRQTLRFDPCLPPRGPQLHFAAHGRDLDSRSFAPRATIERSRRVTRIQTSSDTECHKASWLLASRLISISWTVQFFLCSIHSEIQ